MSGMAFRPREKSKQIHLSVTPLIDVLFLFIIFFTLTSTFKRAGELELSLPESTTSMPTQADEDPRTIELVATEAGSLFLDGETLNEGELLARLRDVHEQQPESGITIQAEAGVRHETVVSLLDSVRDAGFPGVAIGTHTVAPEAEVEE